MGLFSRKPRIDPQELDSLRSDLAEMRLQLDATERSRAYLAVQLQQLDAATAAMTARSSFIDDVSLRMAELDVVKRQVAQIEVVTAKVQSLDGLGSQLSDLAQQLAATSDDAKSAKAETAALNDRVSNVSTELANQLSELSREIDGLATSHTAAADSVVAGQTIATEVLEHVQGAQVRLANEQARYEIAFRQDLAMLAEQVRRARTER